MRVLFAGLQYDYGKPKNGLSVEYTNFFDAIKNMAGVEAEFFPIDIHTQELGRDGANDLLLKRVKEEKPDLLFCYLLSEEIKREVISEITNKTSTKTFNWFADDHWRVPIFSKYWAPLFTLVSTTDNKSVEWYKKYGITNVVKTQWGANQNLYKPLIDLRIERLKDAKIEDAVTFVGKKFGNRGAYIQALENANLQVSAFGNGWQGGRLSQEEMLAVFSQSGINLNFSETHIAGTKAMFKSVAKLFLTKELGKYKFVGHNFFDNLKALRGMRKKCIKGRVFEVPACGGFLMTGKSDDDISQYYVPGKEIVVFENRDDMVEKCRYYLGHPQERDKIAKAGYDRTLKDHTYEQRFKEIFKALGYNLKIEK